MVEGTPRPQAQTLGSATLVVGASLSPVCHEAPSRLPGALRGPARPLWWVRSGLGPRALAGGPGSGSAHPPFPSSQSRPRCLRTLGASSSRPPLRCPGETRPRRCSSPPRAPHPSGQEGLLLPRPSRSPGARPTRALRLPFTPPRPPVSLLRAPAAGSPALRLARWPSSAGSSALPHPWRRSPASSGPGADEQVFSACVTAAAASTQTQRPRPRSRLRLTSPLLRRPGWGLGQALPQRLRPPEVHAGPSGNPGGASRGKRVAELGPEAMGALPAMGPAFSG
ncbi:nascent polypeptide-associated complex subunit alpha, muscle-specific form-like [Camelus ferus]|uniref:Nascent polypeptide-associated complex subunit alpha, muscle-specific form-like n=1 Tax=Camelus ferus TaxID=419612 RepID=A0A8B8RW99_CAMFR|nr:nascent polypeptide-associated complex subunit alpha, muscle-specific form-like [Camelus ferus]